MKFGGDTRDDFFYFFAGYSLLFAFFDFIGYLGVFQVLTYLGFLIFFCLRLNKYFIYIIDHKSQVKKYKVTKAQKELQINVTDAQNNFRQGVIILLLVVAIFTGINLKGNSGNFPNEEEFQKISNSKSTQKLQATTSISADIVKNEELEIGETEILKLETQTGAKNDDIKVYVKEDISSKNLKKEDSESSLLLEKNIEKKVKDVYALTPFTKYGSDFFNILQLQRVLTKLGYYSGIPDGSFNFETKLAIYNTLVFECRWPKDSTKGVFGPKAKECIDNLYINIEDGEEEGIIQ